MKIIYFLCIILSLSTAPLASATERAFGASDTYELCFTPHEKCMNHIIHAIDEAHQSIYMQAYSFTARPIAEALARAKKRGVEVKILVDKQTVTPAKHKKRIPYYPMKYLAQQKIPIWVDETPDIAHNKVLIIDQAWVMTGSFNFTYAAEENNAENMLWLHSPTIAKQYQDNWQERFQKSTCWDNCGGKVNT